MAAIDNDWATALKEEFAKPYYKSLYEFVKEEYSTKVIYPPSDCIFNALHYTSLKDTKVVILGQDPYHEEGQAHGLSFSVNPGVKMRITHKKDIHIRLCGKMLLAKILHALDTLCKLSFSRSHNQL